MFENVIAKSGQNRGLHAAIEQEPFSNRCFEALDAPRCSGLSEIEASGGSAHRSCFGDGDKGFNVLKIHAPDL